MCVSSIKGKSQTKAYLITKNAITPIISAYVKLTIKFFFLSILLILTILSILITPLLKLYTKLININIKIEASNY